MFDAQTIFSEENYMFYTILIMFLIMYGSTLTFEMPLSVRKMFNSPMFRFGALSLIAFRQTGDQKVSLITAFVIMTLFTQLNKRELQESFVNTQNTQINDDIEHFVEDREDNESLTHDTVYPSNDNENTQNDIQEISNMMNIPDPMDDGKLYSFN